MSVNLKLLNAFLLVAEHRSFRRAAELSGRSQSALSLRVRDLRRGSARRCSTEPRGPSA